MRKTMLRWIYFTVLIVFGSTLCFGQQVRITGSENEPISEVDALIYSKRNQTALSSDENGIIRLNTTVFDSIVFFHPSYFRKSLSPEALKAANNNVSLDVKVYVAPTLYFRHDPDFERQKDQPTKLVTMKPKDTKFFNPQTTADLLGLSNQVFIQKSQMGGGSPMIRGFSANNVLIVVDGVRMNNAIFRDGNIQNIITLDANLIDQTQIVFGPGSVFYGSDAMGGVMAFETKTPSIDSGAHYDGNVMLRTATANRENSWHVDLSYGKGKFAGLSSISISNFGELRMGNDGPQEYTRPFFSEYNGSTDTIIRNDDPNVQYFTSYSQVNINQKFRYKPDSLNDFVLHFGLATSSPIPRYDRLLQTRNGLPRYGDWYYGPQKWTQLNGRYLRIFPKKVIADKLTTTIAYQRFEESRFVRPFRSFELEENKENVDVYSLNIDLDKKINKLDVMYGVELVSNLVSSSGQGTKLDSNITFDIATRYPDQSTMNTAAGYVSLKREFAKSWLITGGARLTYISLNAPFKNSFYNFPFQEINLQKSALSGSVGLRKIINKRSFIYGSVASGFRAPNIDDMGKIFDSQPDRVIVPNENLNPEYSYTGEIGFQADITKKVSVLVNSYYSVIDNIIVREDFQLNGSDSLFYNGEMMRIQSLVNANQGTISGLELQVNIELTKELDVKSSYNIISGSTKDGLPIRHVTPNFGNTTISWKHSKFNVIAYANYNAELSNASLSPSEQSKIHLYAKDINGLPYSPAWYTVNLKTAVTFSKSLNLTLGLENILNKRYRPYSSGISAPGRNLIIGLYSKF